MANRFLSDPDPTTAWAKAAVEGKLFTSGELVRHAAERHLRDIRDGERRGIYWRPEEAAHFLNFLPSVFQVTDGPAAGQPFYPLEWHTFVGGSLFGWRNAQNRWRFRGSAFGSGGAPTSRPPSYGAAPALARSSGASLSFGDQIVSVTLAGTELLTPLVARTELASTAAQLARDQALTLAAAAANSASFAEEFSGPAYDTVAAGQAATASGKFFRVSNGDTPRTYTRYQRTASGSVIAAQLATTPALASSDGAKFTSYRRTATASLRTLEAKLFELDLSITDFQAGGPVGVGNAAADTAAIIAAHNALPAGGGAIFLPDGVYEFSQTVTFTKRVNLYGNGCSPVAGSPSRCQIYKGSGVGGPCLILQGMGSKIIGVGVEGRSGNVGDGIEVIAGRVQLQDVSVHRMGRDAIRYGRDGAYFNINLITGDKIYTRENGRHGGYFHDGGGQIAPDVNGGTFIGWESANNGGDGLRLGHCWFINLIGFVPQLNSGWGLNVIGGVSPSYTGSRYHTILGGEQNEGNALGNIYNSGYACSFIGVTPGDTGTLFTDEGTLTTVISPGLNKFPGLKSTGVITAEGQSATTFRPIVARGFGGSSNGRGVGYAYLVPNGTGLSRPGAYTDSEQEATNKDNWGVTLNISGVMTKALTVSPDYSIKPATTNAWTLGSGALQFSRLYVSGGVTVGANQVLGPRLAALPADATDLPSLITLANAMKARMKKTGGHGLVED